MNNPVFGDASTLRIALAAGDCGLVNKIVNHYPGDGWRMVVRQLLAGLMAGREGGHDALRVLVSSFAYLIDDTMLQQAQYEAEWELKQAGLECETLKGLLMEIAAVQLAA